MKYIKSHNVTLHSQIVSVCHFDTEEKVMITDIRNIDIIRLVKCLAILSANNCYTFGEKILSD